MNSSGDLLSLLQDLIDRKDQSIKLDNKLCKMLKLTALNIHHIQNFKLDADNIVYYQNAFKLYVEMFKISEENIISWLEIILENNLKTFDYLYNYLLNIKWKVSSNKYMMLFSHTLDKINLQNLNKLIENFGLYDKEFENMKNNNYILNISKKCEPGEYKHLTPFMSNKIGQKYKARQAWHFFTYANKLERDIIIDWWYFNKNGFDDETYLTFLDYYKYTTDTNFSDNIRQDESKFREIILTID